MAGRILKTQYAANKSALPPVVADGFLVIEYADTAGKVLLRKHLSLRDSARGKAWTRLSHTDTLADTYDVRVYVYAQGAEAVYFDDIFIEAGLPPVPVIWQENHFDPFGLNLKGIEETDLQTQQITPEFRFQYNGKEKTETHRLEV